MSEFSIATWNVNSLRVRLGHVSDWLSANRPAVLCLQETKVVDLNFPANELRGIGYECAFFGQPAYNGVAILSRYPLADVAFGIPNFADEQKRVIAATIHPQGGGRGDANYFCLCSKRAACRRGKNTNINCDGSPPCAIT